MLTYATRNIHDYVSTRNAKTVTSIDRQNALVGRFDIHNLSIIFYIASNIAHILFLSFLMTKTISPFRTSHSQSILSPSFSFHCFIMLIGITVRNEAKLDDAFDTVVISPTAVIIFGCLYLYYSLPRTLPYLLP
jgi:hypothetical protein